MRLIGMILYRRFRETEMLCKDTDRMLLRCYNFASYVLATAFHCASQPARGRWHKQQSTDHQFEGRVYSSFIHLLLHLLDI